MSQSQHVYVKFFLVMRVLELAVNDAYNITHSTA